MGLKIADKYIFRELLGPFMVGVLTFVVLITGHILFTVVQVVVEHAVPLPNILKFLSLQVPRATVLALPVSALLACSLGLNRLATENELTVLRSGGSSLARLLMPAVLIGLLASAASLGLSEYVVPWADREAESMLRRIALSQRALGFQPGKFTSTGSDLHFFVEDVDGRRDQLKGVHVFWVQLRAFPALLKADQANFTSWGLQTSPAVSYHLDQEGNLTLTQAPQGVAVNLQAVFSDLPGPVEGLQNMRMGQLLAEGRRMESQYSGQGRRHLVELHWRLALAASCLVFALLAAPLTLRFSHRESLVGVTMSLVVAFAYYVIMLWLRMLGEAGTLGPAVSGWLQNGALAAVAAWGLWRYR